MAREEHQKQEQLHLQDREQLTESLHQKDLQYQELLRDTKMRHAEEMLHASESFEERLRETEKRYTARFSSLRTELHLRVKTEVNNVFKFEIKLLAIRPTCLFDAGNENDYNIDMYFQFIFNGCICVISL